MLGCCDCFRLSNCVTLSSQIHRGASGHALTVDMLKQYESQIENIKRTLPKNKSMMCRDLRGLLISIEIIQGLSSIFLLV